jgi:hypothetical protein
VRAGAGVVVAVTVASAGWRSCRGSVGNDGTAGDGGAEQSSGLTRYSTVSGTPPGLFLGAGLANLGDGECVERGSQVDEEHMYRMLGECVDLLNGRPVGRSPNRQPASLADRISRRLGRLPAELTEEGRAAAGARIEAKERARAHRSGHPWPGSISRSLHQNRFRWGGRSRIRAPRRSSMSVTAGPLTTRWPTPSGPCSTPDQARTACSKNISTGSWPHRSPKDPAL